jgi:hypothetical protein
MNANQITSKWATIAEVCYSHCVNTRNPNPSAAGGVCLIQVRANGTQLLARRVNSNCRHTETGDAFEITPAELDYWLNLNGFPDA